MYSKVKTLFLIRQKRGDEVAPLYTVNTFYYQWIIKKLLWPIAGQNIGGREIQAEAQEERSRFEEMPSSLQRRKCMSITSNPQDLANHRLLKMG